MGKKLENLRWKPRWVSQLGCIKGCLDYLNLDVSDAWLFGATGHAFIINIHDVVCPSGPTAWNCEQLSKLGKNLGYNIEKVCAFKSKPDFTEKQKLAWEHARTAIDKGIPCYGWELDIPEFYVVYGYDEEGYYFSGPGCDSGKGPKSYKELGDTGIGVLEMYSVEPGQKSDEVKTVKDAFEFVLEHSKSPTKWIFPKYKAGLAGFDNWIQALENGSADGFGMAYNSAVWCECRMFAVEFLKEAKERLDEKFNTLFDQAIPHYETVAQNLMKVAKSFSFPPKGDEVKNTDLCKAAVTHLKDAKKGEESGLKALEEILKRL
jgi:hypothetical protein